MTDDILTQLRLARHNLDFAWSIWGGMTQPASVTLYARIVVGEDWLKEHEAPKDQKAGGALLAKLKAQLEEQRALEAQPGQMHDNRVAWDQAEGRFLDTERVYLHYVHEANAAGISE
jgi:hypothetical protein